MPQSEQAQCAFTEPQVRILLAAEQLFALNGIEGASLREIAVLAQHRNPYAAQYHFGTRDGLARAIFAFRMNQMEGPRGRMLVAARAAGRLHDPRAIMEMLYLPQVEVVKAEGGESFAAFLCQYLLRTHSAAYGDFGTPLPPHLVTIMGLLRQCVPGLSDAAAQRRLVSSSLVFLHFLSVYGRHDETAQAGESFTDRLWDTIGQIEVATLMPLSEPRASTVSDVCPAKVEHA